MVRALAAVALTSNPGSQIPILAPNLGCANLFRYVCFSYLCVPTDYSQ